MIERHLEKTIEKWLFRNKIIVIYGARQVGKTTLSKAILERYGQPEGYFNCEIASVRKGLESKEPILLKKFIGKKELVVFDEAQYVPDIGLTLKLLADTYPQTQIIATGSSSFELANRTSEPLTGRSLQFILYPLSYEELADLYPPYERSALVDYLMQYGLYPEIVQSSVEEARILLDDLTSKYLYKDILTFEDLRNPEVLRKLLQLLALQIGNEVSYNELAKNLKVNTRTVERYIDLLEKAFVIFRLSPFSRNLRKEITKKQKIYFYDLGIRNSIVQQYQPIEMRTDKGGLWENFLIVERIKWLQAHQIRPNRYFWRTHDGQEIDYLEDYNGQLTGFEFKWKAGKRKVPPAFQRAYPEAKVQFIDRNNYESFITD